MLVIEFVQEIRCETVPNICFVGTCLCVALVPLPMDRTLQPFHEKTDFLVMYKSVLEKTHKTFPVMYNMNIG